MLPRSFPTPKASCSCVKLPRRCVSFPAVTHIALNPGRAQMSWNLNYAGIARMWRGGCIIKSVFLGDITNAYQKTQDLESLLFDDFFNKAVHKAQPGWRRVVAQGVIWGIPLPAFSTALAFFDGYRSEIVPANLLQAQVRIRIVGLRSRG